MKALRFEININTTNYNEQFDSVPQEVINLLEDGYFDDNGDLPIGNCILVPVDDLNGNIDLSKYEVVNINKHEFNVYKDGSIIYDENDRPTGLDGDYMGFTSRGYYFKQI